MQNIQEIISDSVKSLYDIDYSPEISPAPKPELGEYCIGIFPIVKIVGKAPNMISLELANELAKHTDIFLSTSATGGYVNFFLTDTLWLDIFRNIEETGEKEGIGKTIVVDYIGANVGKPLHIGHICTPSIGQVIINTYKHLGYQVISDSHFGDWGGIFGKLIYQWKKTSYITTLSITTGERKIIETDMMNRERLENPQNLDADISFLVQLYQEFHKDTQEIDEIGARGEFKKLVEKDPENTELWKKFTSTSLTEIENKLKLLNVNAYYNIGESFYEGIGLPRPNGEDYPDLQYTMKDIVAELIAKGIATDNSITSNGDDKSVGVVFPDEMKLPSCILQKKDGTGLYLTSDLAAIKYRLTNGWNPSKIIYSVDVRQQLHLKQAFTIAKMAWPELTKDVEFFHAFNGFIKLKEGAMSTRHGTVIFLEALIDEGNERTRKILEEKGRSGEKELSRENIQAITIGAIKYSYLTQDREKDVTFDWDKALNFEGHSGPYIQYAYVRASKILANQVVDLDATPKALSSYDKSLIGLLARFEEAVMTTAKSYKPHHIALYVYDLAVTFNSFYVHTPKILEESDISLRAFRLGLVSKTSEILEKSFKLLAIEMPSEM